MIIVVLAVFNTAVAAYVLVYQQTVARVRALLLALELSISMTAMATVGLDQKHPSLAGFQAGATSLLEMFMRMASARTSGWTSWCRAPPLLSMSLWGSSSEWESELVVWSSAGQGVGTVTAAGGESLA